MEITEVKVRKIYNNKNTRARALLSITIDNSIVIHDIRVIERSNGTCFIAMPSRKMWGNDSNTHMDIVHPINQETRDMFTDTILEAYHKAKEKLSCY